MSDKIGSEESYDAPVGCVVSGFTAINHPRPVVPSGSTKPSTNIASNASQKKRKAPASSINASSKKPKNVQRAEHSREKGISKNEQEAESSREILCSITGQRIQDFEQKLLLSGSSVKSKLPAIHGESFQDDAEAIFGSWGTSDTDLLTNKRRPGLIENYQAAYDPTLQASGVGSSSSQSFQVSSNTGFESAFKFAGDGFWHEENTPAHHVIREMHERSIAGHLSEKRCPSPRDFEPPPSAQLPKTSSDKLPGAAVLNEEYLIESGVPSVNHEIDADFLEGADELLGILQGDKPTLQGDLGIFSDTNEDHDFEDSFDDWPDNLSIPDAVTIFEDGNQKENGGELISGRLDTMPMLTRVSGNVRRPTQNQPPSPQGSENGICESSGSHSKSSFIDVTPPRRPQQLSTSQTSLHRSSSPKLQWLPPKTFTPTKSKIATPVPPKTPPHVVSVNAVGKHLPFARAPFPKPLLDRSPIPGLSNATVLRICFRIGEALNAAAQAWRSKFDAIIELFARVVTSSRDSNGGYKQYFQFADLFTDKPPYLSGMSTIWKGVGLWDQDLKVFSGVAGRGKMCRVVGRIKRREEPPGGCEMTVLSMWEVDWEDVGVAKGVVCS